MSSILTLEAGVPQESILGPLVYKMYYKYIFPGVVHQENSQNNKGAVRTVKKQIQSNVKLPHRKKIITPSQTETLLGFKLHESMGFSEHIMDCKDSLIKTYNKRV